MWWAQLLNNIVALLGNGSGGGATSFESIATATGTGSSGTITFSSIPSTYKHLQIRWNALNTGSTYDNLIIRLNSDTASNYSYHILEGHGSGTYANGAANQSFMYCGFNNSNLIPSYPLTGIVDIIDYADTSKYKTIRSFSGIDLNGSGAVALQSGSWRSTSATNTLTFSLDASGNFATTTKFALYGIKGA